MIFWGWSKNLQNSGPFFELVDPKPLRIDRAKVLGWNAIEDWLPDATQMQREGGDMGTQNAPHMCVFFLKVQM